MNKQITVNEFMQLVKETYSKQFPNSICEVNLFKCLGTSITINCYLAGDKKELYNGYVQNDMFSIDFWMHESENGLKGATLESVMSDNLLIECRAKSYRIKPDNKYICYSSRNLSYRKTSGDYTKIIKSLEKFFIRLKTQLNKDLEENQIHDEFKQLVIKKLA